MNYELRKQGTRRVISRFGNGIQVGKTRRTRRSIRDGTVMLRYHTIVTHCWGASMSRIISTAILALVLGFGAADAQDFPTKTIKLIVPFTPGGPVDALGRVVAQYLQVKLGQNIVIENRPGGGTSIGAKAAAAAPPDGYTLLLIGPNVAYYPVLLPKVEFDPTAALAPVATLVTWSHVIAVAPAVPAKTISELVVYAKANPRQAGVRLRPCHHAAYPG